MNSGKNLQGSDPLKQTVNDAAYWAARIPNMDLSLRNFQTEGDGTIKIFPARFNQ